MLLLQMTIILAAVRLVGLLFRCIHQPQVIGEMVGGVLLGPSVLGWMAPRVSAALFPPWSFGFLEAISHVGLVLFLFLIGLKHDPERIRGHRATAVIASHASILLPLFLGAAIALVLYPCVSDDSVTFTQFALFMGTAMSITAFPVLARILEERQLMNTAVGAAAIVCAAVDDVTGWLIFAGVLLLVHAQKTHVPIWFAIPATAAFVAVMLWVAPRVLRRLTDAYERRGRLSHDMFAVTLLFAFGSACATDYLGIHPLFGAFLAGVAVPKNQAFIRELVGRLDDVTVVLILPLFFAFSGLRTRIGLLSGAHMWLYFLLIFATAVAGKLGGAALAGRATGLSWREASSLGILVNARGLIELVVLNIGLDAGVISPALFAIMVLMAIATTLMTVPALDVIYPARLRRAAA
jgi:Kef-type K+ transport system membrane component KefB